MIEDTNTPLINTESSADTLDQPDNPKEYRGDAMLAIHQPFPIIKASIGGVVTLATGFYGTVAILRNVMPSHTTTATNQSKTVSRPVANTSPASDTSEETAKTDASSDKKLWQAANASKPTPTTANNYVPPTAPSTTSTSNTTSLQLQPTSNSTATNTTQTPTGTTTVSQDPSLLDTTTQVVAPVVNLLP